MLTPLQYNALCDEIAVLYAGLENSIIEDMTRRILRMGFVSDSSAWQTRMLMESGLLYEDILAEIAQRTGQTDRQIQELFRNAGIQAVRNDNFYYRQAGLVVPRNMSDSALQVLNAGYQKCSGSLKNLTLTTANTSQQAFIQACNLAYMQTISGTMDYNTAVRHAVQSAAGNGAVVRYPSGHQDKLDVAVRRAVLTGVGQTVRQISFQNAKDFDCDLMEISAHAGARPSHAEWQGQIVSLSGRRGYLTLDAIGYGTADGFGGVNCRHDWFPFFEGFSERAYSDERLRELAEHRITIDGVDYSDYELSQKQRYYERQIREKKRQVLAAQVQKDNAQTSADAAAADAEFQKKSVQLKQAEQKLKDFLHQTGFLNDSSRVWVDGFGRSQAQKAVWANRKYQQGKNPPPAAPASPSVPKSPKPKNPSGSAALPAGKIAETPEILQKTAEKVDKFLDAYAARKSKWSGIAIRSPINWMKKATGKKNWDCSITIREDADIKTVIHELLHARSCSHFSKSEFREHRNMEEVTVELYAQEICKKNKYSFEESYPIFVGYLREINRIVKIEKDDFDFGRKLLDMDMRMRYNWIKEQSDKADVSSEMRFTLEYLLEQLREGELS